MKRFLAVFLTVFCLVFAGGCGNKSDKINVSEIISQSSAALDEQESSDESAEENSEETKSEEQSDPDSSEPDSAFTEYDEDSGDPTDAEMSSQDAAAIDEHGSYTSKEDVALYIHTYGQLPDNFITKQDAQSLGWTGGSLEVYAEGMCIGGNRFGNYEGILPEKDGRIYHECDIDTLGAKSRGAKRIVFSNDGLIYYTEDHYETFELLYGGEDE